MNTRHSGPARLRRTAPAAPSRIVHLGLGAFARAHQAWYTDSVGGSEWGITGFTGRSRTVADQLAAQDGLVHVLVRDPDGDRADLVSSVVAAHPGADTARFALTVSDPATALITITVTESGYRMGPDGRPDPDSEPLWHDMERLRRERPGGAEAVACTTTPGRLLAALDLRRRRDAGPLAIVPCDNIAGNGALLRAQLSELAERVSLPLREWIGEHASFVGTSVDRITPSASDSDRAAVTQLTGHADAAVVVAEPFHDWVLSGAFPAGRPTWEDAGARIVDELEPFERRKLWLLNGAHSLLAYAGLAHGVRTVAEAIRLPLLRAAVESFWDEAERVLDATGARDLEVPQYRRDLLARFENARIEHRLAQISAEGSAKVRMRAVPVALAERAAGRDASASLAVVATWVAFVLTGEDVVDGDLERVRGAARGTRATAVGRLVALLSDELAQDRDAVSTVAEQVDALLPVHIGR